jgi:hypothetical protein
MATCRVILYLYTWCLKFMEWGRERAGVLVAVTFFLLGAELERDHDTGK